jgi:flagellar export protein FliJ
MKAFRFRLDTPLRLARARRGELRRELAVRLRELDAVERAIATVEKRRSELAGEMASGVSAGIDGGELARLTISQLFQENRLPALLEERVRLTRLERSVKNQLTAIGREVQVLERLRSEARAEWVKDRLYREQLQSDDLTLQRRAAEIVAGARQGKTT